MIWIFGHGRSGSSWLTRMMETLPAHTRWDEPLVGYLFGNFSYQRPGGRKDEHFVLGGEKEVRSSPIRVFVLEAVNRRFPEVAGNGYLVVKEPHGALGAPLLMEALPESRMILLVRDPRDVISSHLDAHRKGSWGLQVPEAEGEPNVFVEDRAQAYLRDFEYARKAYESHGGPRVLVRYEDLRADTLATMSRIYSVLGISVAEEELIRAVEKHAWESIPKADKGAGKARRKATPGGWKEDLTPEQANIVERCTASVLKEFYRATP